VAAPNMRRRLRRGDILVIEADPDDLASAISTLGLRLEAEVEAEAEEEAARSEDAEEEDPDAVAGSEGAEARGDEADPEETGDDDATEDEATEDEAGQVEERRRESTEVVMREFVVMPDSPMLGRSAADVELRSRHGLSLLALSREGDRSVRRLRATRVRAGDVLLLQGIEEALAGFSADFRCVPLAPRDLKVPDKGRSTLAVVVMALAIGGAAFGLLPAAVSFVAAVVVYMAWRVVPLREVYTVIDWPVIVLLGAMIPVAGAMASTGAADLLASGMLDAVAGGGPVVALTLILVASMVLSDFMNNAATAAVLAPIAISTALQLGVNTDTFLMAVAIGASCAFLTPIGHQNNTLILGPCGFHFGDYWRLGLPLEILVVAVGVPVLLQIWPL